MLNLHLVWLQLITTGGGTNSPKNLVPSTVTLNNWVIMSADPTTVTDAEIGDVKTISVNFNKYSSFGAIKDLSKTSSSY